MDALKPAHSIPLSRGRLDLVGALERGDIVSIAGVSYIKKPGKENGARLEPGDLYLGQRNSASVLTLDRVDRHLHCCFPVESAYPFNLYECIGVQIVNEAESAQPRLGAELIMNDSMGYVVRCPTEGETGYTVYLQESQECRKFSEEQIRECM